eukprot:TRINITY_DN3851_c0_g4_i1.p1 TRINITY_DN3851_c0_g4~~TRINITY_DN3851_c0_g4_i1.p1  ORF type:complete len:212 (+),score=38.73 TRINITY_DN3851_c0_g4_i1:59-694(+)
MSYSVEVGQSWDSYTSEARGLVNVVEQELVVLAEMAGQSTENEVDTLKNQISNFLETLEKANNGIDLEGLSHGERLQVERFKGIHQDSSEELDRTYKMVLKKQKREQLMSDIHTSIAEYSTSQQLLQQESDDIGKTMKRVQNIYEEANASHAALLHSNTVLSRITSRTRELAANVPVVHHLINKINRKTNRDQIIISAVVAFCLFVIWVFY